MELILLPLKGTFIPNDIPDNIEIHEIEGSLYSLKGNLRYSYNLYRKLNEISKEKPIDLIHCLYPNSSVLGAALFKRKSPKIKILYDLRSPWIEMSIERGSIPKYVASIYRRAAYFSEAYFNNYVDGYIFITEGLKRFYNNKIKLDSKPFDIIPSGVDLNLFSRKNSKIIREKYNLKDNNFLLGYVGGISRMRELDFIINALQKLTDIDENYRLMFIGDGDDKEHLEALAKKLQIQDKVIFTGKVPYEQVPFYMSAFDAGICHLPDKLVFRYSFPMKVLEYLACRTPVFASDIEAHRDIGKQLKGVYIYDSKEDFKKFIPTYLDQKITTNSGIIDDFSWDSLIRKIIKNYKNILNQ